jgi:hypothetical protein
VFSARWNCEKQPLETHQKETAGEKRVDKDNHNKQKETKDDKETTTTHLT